MHLERVIYEVEGNIALLKMNHPPANTLGRKTLEDLKTAIDAAEQDEKVKVIVLTGEGNFFIAGADLKEINNIDQRDEAERLALYGQDILNKIEALHKPVIAAINGACLGGGMELAMACHIRIASERAKFGQPEIKLGLIPGFGGTQRLARLTNKGVAMEWILTGEMYTAQDAQQLGIVSKVVQGDEVLEVAKAMAKTISEKSMLAISKSIAAIEEGYELPIKEGLLREAKFFGETFATEDKKEGVQAFLEKRAPIFKDK